MPPELDAAALWRRSGSTLPDRRPADPHTLAQRRRQLTRRLHWALRIEAWPPGVWLALQLLALWPVGLWTVQRLAEGSGDPLRLVALLPLAIAAERGRIAGRRAARGPWLAAALIATVACTALEGIVPWPVCGVLAALALGCAWAAFSRRDTPVLPLLALWQIAGAAALPGASSVALDGAVTIALIPLTISIIGALGVWLLRGENRRAPR